MEIFGIKFAPLNIPLKRRLQTLSLAIWFFIIYIGYIVCSIFAVYILLFTTTARYFLLLYFVWVYYDWDTCDKGGRSDRLIRLFTSTQWYEHLNDYFPTSLVKTVDIDTNRNYLFCAFPHGLFPLGTIGALKCESRGARKLFPGLQLPIVMLSVNFKFPILRDIYLNLGFVGSSEESLDYLLGTKPEPPLTGTAPILFVGGTAEAIETQYGKYRLYIQKRKGFVRVALKHGTPLVPVFSFGESNVWEPLQTPFIYRMQHYLRKKIGFCPFFLKGRGFFQYSVGVFPYRTPLTTVVGSPIEVPKVPQPTKEQINEYHKLFIDKLIDLFETHKHKYLQDADSKHLEFL